MMKHKLGKVFGDVCFYIFATFFITGFLAIVFTSARTFLWQEILKLNDLRGSVSGPARFMEKLKKAGIKPEEFNPSLLIRKRSRELVVLSGSIVVAKYPIGLGRNPIGIKLNAKDQKTPEGHYYICDKDELHHYHLFLQINYPSPDDAKRGSVQQLLKPGEENRIIRAWNKQKIPFADTALGGNLGIHGFGAESNWTKDGSIAMHNRDIEEIFWVLATGTQVAILP